MDRGAQGFREVGWRDIWLLRVVEQGFWGRAFWDEGVTSEMRGFLHPLEQQREPHKQWKQNVPRHRSWRCFIAGKDPRAASRTVLFHQNLLMVLEFHMYLREWWMARGWWLMEEILRKWVGTWVWAVLLVCRSRSFPSGHRQPLEDFFFMFDRLYFF